MKETNLKHKELTDEEVYQRLKKTDKKDSDIFMNSKTWKKLRLIELAKEGKNWSK